MSRTTREVFDHHVTCLYNKDLDGIMADFSASAVYVNSLGVQAQGPEAIREIYVQFLRSQVPGTSSSITNKIIYGEIVFLEWISDSPISSVSDGVDTFVIREGMIQAQTAKFTEIAK